MGDIVCADYSETCGKSHGLQHPFFYVAGGVRIGGCRMKHVRDCVHPGKLDRMLLGNDRTPESS